MKTKMFARPGARPVADAELNGDCIGHHYIGRDYIIAKMSHGHDYIGHNYKGHNYMMTKMSHCHELDQLPMRDVTKTTHAITTT